MPQRRLIRIAVLIALIAGGVALRAWFFSNLSYDLKVCASDFAGIFTGGKLVRTPELYSTEAAFAVERQAMGCSHENEVFVKPPFYAWLMWPFAQMPFLTAIAVWRALGVAAIALFVWMWPGDRLAALAACAWFLPVATNFTSGQDVGFLLLASLIAYRLLEKGRPVWAGVVLAAFAAKFHLFFLMTPVFLLQRKMWRTILGGCCAGLVLAAASALAAGPNWISRYWTALHQSRLDPYTYNMVNLTSVFGYGSRWIIPASIAVAAMCWYLIRSAPLPVAFAVTLAGGVLLTPHTTLADGLLFLPGLLLTRETPHPALRALATFALTPFYAFLPTGTLQVIVVMLIASAAWLQRSTGSTPEPAGLARAASAG